MSGPLKDIYGMIAGEGPMSDDLVKRLKMKAAMIELGERIAWGSDSAIMREAADRIEALEAQLVEARMQSLSHLGQAQEAYESQLKAEAQLAAREWQPMETAPSVHCLLFGDTRHDQNIVSSGWVAQNGMTYVDGGHVCRATHWMPLPEPPKAD